MVNFPIPKRKRWTRCSAASPNSKSNCAWSSPTDSNRRPAASDEAGRAAFSGLDLLGPTLHSRLSGCHEDDPQLAAWAFDAWAKASDGKLTVRPELVENRARIRIYWASGDLALYGETRPIQVNGQRGAAIYVLPDTSALGEKIADAAKADPLFRDSIVYLTCLHESGHALGLPHTRAFEDIMYSFGFGGDIVEYFERYRRKLQTRSDIKTASGISAHDREVLALITGAQSQN